MDDDERRRGSSILWKGNCGVSVSPPNEFGEEQPQQQKHTESKQGKAHNTITQSRRRRRARTREQEQEEELLVMAPSLLSVSPRAFEALAPLSHSLAVPQPRGSGGRVSASASSRAEDKRGALRFDRISCDARMSELGLHSRSKYWPAIFLSNFVEGTWFRVNFSALSVQS